MCGRYSLTQMQGLTKRFLLNEDRAKVSALLKLFNIAPTEEAPVVIEEDGRRILTNMTFGLVPSWAKDVKIGAQCINARAETVAEKPAFKDAFRRRRCLVATDGYYEWKHEGKAKIPYRVTMKDDGLFAFAGLWDRWTRPDGKELQSFTIITTDTNGLTKEFHDRMPVIVAPENESLWLAPYVTEIKTLQPLLKPYDPAAMKLTRVSPLLNKATNKGPDVLKPAEENPELNL